MGHPMYECKDLNTTIYKKNLWPDAYREYRLERFEPALEALDPISSCATLFHGNWHEWVRWMSRSIHNTRVSAVWRIKKEKRKEKRKKTSKEECIENR